MNRLIAAPFLTLALLGGCATLSQNQESPDMHNAMNALDYRGVYRAEPPVEKGSFRVVELKSDNQFRLLTAQQEEKTGVYIWEKSGSVVQLMLSSGVSPRFFVGEGFLRREENTGSVGQILRKE